MRILSIHVPKTAGLSLGEQWRILFGDGLQTIYRPHPAALDLPSDMDLSPQVNPNTVVLHAQTAPAFLDKVDADFRVTFLRHPIENLLSIYAMICTPNNNFLGVNLSEVKCFRDFVQLPRLRYLYTQSFFKNYDMRRFNFIGDFTQYDSELKRLGTLLGVTFNPNIIKNVTTRKPGCPADYKNNKAALLAQINSDPFYAEALADDIAFYNQWKGK